MPVGRTRSKENFCQQTHFFLFLFFLLYFVRDASGKNSVIKNEKSLALDMCFCNGGGCLVVWLGINLDSVCHLI